MNITKIAARLIVCPPLLITVFCIAGCSDAAVENISRYGDKHEITCYSGGQEVIRSTSTGKPVIGDGFVTWYDGKDGYGSSADCIYRTKR